MKNSTSALILTFLVGQLTLFAQTNTSVLSEGDVYKFAVEKEGVYRLTYDFLKNKLGISNLDNINPRNIKLYGNGGGMLPTLTATPRIDDLAENHIQVVGEEDGKFDAGDYVLFYAEGPNKWTFDAISKDFNMQKNLYATRNYYFIKISSDSGQRIQNQTALSNTSYLSNTFNDFARFEDDKANLMHDWGVRASKAQGSGQKWYGDWFKTVREYQYNNLFSFPNLLNDQPVRVRAEMALRALRASRFTLELNGQAINSQSASRVDLLTGERDNEVDYVRIAVLTDNSLVLNDGAINAVVKYPNPDGANDGSEGWLDFIQLNVRRRLIMAGDQMAFRDAETLAYPSASFQLDNANSDILIWDISNPLQVANQEFTRNGNQISFGTNTSTLKTFIAFNKNQGLLSPEAVGKIEPQNLHGIRDADMLIVYHKSFEAQAQRLAVHRSNHSGLRVTTALVDQVFNEFSSGRLDPTAIRDFTKMLRDRNPNFKYLLLFGDGSFDHRDIYGLGNNFIPTYQREAANPIFAFPSDDYYCILDNKDSSDPLKGSLDIAVGRLTVKTEAEAEAVVDKIIQYDLNPKSLSDWRNRVLFVADDEDGNDHLEDANRIADKIASSHRFLNVDKVYLDAFPQVSSSGGDRFPAANEEVNRAIFKGILAMTYLGHGGPSGLAQERVITIPDIVNWSNKDQLPLIITATCSFTGYDNPSFTTAGEEALLNPKGGAIALLTAVRAVFANQNADLTEAVMDRLFVVREGKTLSLGEVMREGKNSFSINSSITINSRKFALIGDPSQHLAVPGLRITTTKINNSDIAGVQLDTIRALQRVTIEGIITDENGAQLTNFNGIVYPTVFDKKVTVTTLGQDPRSSPTPFSVQRNIIFKGRASVTNGAFKFSFVLPKDINYQFGSGKISYYAADTDQMQDASGSYENIIIGGAAPDAFADTQGPKVEVFMNTEDFVFGSVTNSSPTLLVKLQDDNGINVVGNSIGHDLEAIIDNNTQQSFLLNDFYQSDLDDDTKGTVRYPLFDLEDGRHEIQITAWDVANNAAQGYTEFIVASSENIALERVLNYPNPFTDYTCFQFDHNAANQEMDVLIQIYTISGRLVKTIEKTILTDGAIRRDDCIEWDGKDDFGDRLARGTYLYKVKIRTNLAGSSTLKGESDFEKLVILK